MSSQEFYYENDISRGYEAVLRDVRRYREFAAINGETMQFGDASIEIRDYQLDSWSAINTARSEGKDSALVHLATGLGKTTVGVVDALDFASSFYAQEKRPPKIMFAVHQKEILDQASKRFSQFAPTLSQGRYAGRQKSVDNAVTFATMQSLSQGLDTLDPSEFDYIIYDEAHHSQAETFKNVIEHFKPAFKLALTATPDRMDNNDIRSIFGPEVYAKSLPEAMTEGYLADVDYHIVFDDAVKQAMEKDFSPETLSGLRELLGNESRNEEIALQIWEEMERIDLQQAKTIVFCQDIDQADEMARLLGGKAYHSGVKDVRSDILNDFRDGVLQIITTRDMFNEGVDIPDARLLVFLRSTSSKTVFEQQLGRGLRRHKGKDTVAVLDFVANVERLGHIKELVDSITERSVVKGSGNGTEPAGGLFVATDHAGFDFDKISISLLAKFYEIRERNNRFVLHTMEDAATLWRQNFGDEEPTKSKIEQASKDGLFPSNIVIRRLGGTMLLKKFLGFDARPSVDTLSDAADLWIEQFGDEEPSAAKIIEASRLKQFVSTTIIAKLGGINALKSQLGFQVPEQIAFDIKTIDEAAQLWRENFGDEEPTRRSVQGASAQGDFISITALEKLGGLLELKKATGFTVPIAPLEVTTIEEAAQLWCESFGDDEPSILKITEAYRQGLFVSKHRIASLGGVVALKESLGMKLRDNVQSMDEAAQLWRERFGGEEPTVARIGELSGSDMYISVSAIQKLGGIGELKNLLGFETHEKIRSLSEAATLWRQNMGDELPNEANVILASESGKFISLSALYKFGTIKSLRAELGFRARPSVDSLEAAAQLWRDKFGDAIPTHANLAAASKAGEYITVNTVNALGGVSALRQLLGFEVRPVAKSMQEAAILWRRNFGDRIPNQEIIAEASQEKRYVSQSTITKLGGLTALRMELDNI